MSARPCPTQTFSVRFNFYPSLQSLYRLCTTGRGSFLSPIGGLYLDGRASLWFGVPRDPTVRKCDARLSVSANSVNALGKFRLPRPRVPNHHHFNGVVELATGTPSSLWALSLRSTSRSDLCWRCDTPRAGYEREAETGRTAIGDRADTSEAFRVPNPPDMSALVAAQVFSAQPF